MTTQKNTSIAVLDTDHHFSKQINSILLDEEHLQIVLTNTQMEDFIGDLPNTEVDIVLFTMDESKVETWVQGIKRIHQLKPSAQVLVLTDSSNPELILEILNQDVSGVYAKAFGLSKLVYAIKCVIQYKAYIDETYMGYMVKEFSEMSKSFNTEPELMLDNAKVTSALSRREQEVYELLIRGKCNSQISKEMFISDNTTRNHINSIIRKLHSTNRTEAVITAFKKGWVIYA